MGRSTLNTIICECYKYLGFGGFADLMIKFVSSSYRLGSSVSLVSLWRALLSACVSTLRLAFSRGAETKRTTFCDGFSSLSLSVFCSFLWLFCSIIIKIQIEIGETWANIVEREMTKSEKFDMRQIRTLLIESVAQFDIQQQPFPVVRNWIIFFLPAS